MSNLIINVTVTSASHLCSPALPQRALERPLTFDLLGLTSLETQFLKREFNTGVIT